MGGRNPGHGGRLSVENYLLLVLEGPMLSFGREAVDARGPVSDFPGASLLTGLLANALGWRREERDRHSRLQARLRFAARLDRIAARLEEFQTAQLASDDAGWTTRGAPEKRGGGKSTYDSPHIRRRQFDADGRVAVALHLLPAADDPDVAVLATALAAPARPLFLGRKPFLPSRPILAGTIQAGGLLAALAGIPGGEDSEPRPRVLLPPDEPGAAGETVLVSDLRDWQSGVHGGQRRMCVFRLPAEAAP
jgi:CRISPR system Cascade subunit CasD